LATDLDLLRKLIAGQITDYQMTKRYLHKQGSQVWVLLSVSLVRDDHGEPLPSDCARSGHYHRGAKPRNHFAPAKRNTAELLRWRGLAKRKPNPQTGRFVSRQPQALRNHRIHSR